MCASAQLDQFTILVGHSGSDNEKTSNPDTNGQPGANPLFYSISFHSSPPTPLGVVSRENARLTLAAKIGVSPFTLLTSPFFRPSSCNRGDPLDGGFHFFQAGPFQPGVRGVAAAREVGGGQPELGHAGAVGAAADDLFFGLAAETFECLDGKRDGTRLLVQAVTHVAVLFFDIDVDLRFGELGTDFRGDLIEQLGLVGQLRRLERAEQDVELDFFDTAGELVRVEEPIAAVVRFGATLDGQLFDESGGDTHGVGHPVFGDRRVDVHTMDRDGRPVGRKGLDVDLVVPFAIQGVTSGYLQAVNVEFIDAAPDLLVASEADADWPMREVRMLHHAMDRLHDDRHARLVVGPEQGRAVGGDDRLADQFIECRRIVRRDNSRWFVTVSGGACPSVLQGDRSALIVFDHLRLDVATGRLGRGVQMGTKTDRRGILAGVAGQCRGDDPVFVLQDVGQSDFVQLLDEQPA